MSASWTCVIGNIVVGARRRAEERLGKASARDACASCRLQAGACDVMQEVEVLSSLKSIRLDLYSLCYVLAETIPDLPSAGRPMQTLWTRWPFFG